MLCERIGFHRYEISNFYNKLSKIFVSIQSIFITPLYFEGWNYRDINKEKNRERKLWFILW